MNLSTERMAFIRSQVMFGARLDPRAAKDLQGHNDHLIELCEAKGRLLLSAEIEIDQLRAKNNALQNALSAIDESLEREYWSEYAGLDETRDILDDALNKEAPNA